MVASFGQTGYLGFRTRLQYSQRTVHTKIQLTPTAAKSRMGNAAMGNCIIMHLESFRARCVRLKLQQCCDCKYILAGGRGAPYVHTQEYAQYPFDPPLSDSVAQV